MEQTLCGSRTEMAGVLLDLIRPLKSHYSPGKAWLCVGATAAHYGEKAARMEGFARVLWGLGPLWAGDNQNLDPRLKEECRQWLSIYQEGIKNGTDPSHEEYWGELKDFDQKMVEMAALAVAVSLNPDKLWDPLDPVEKDHLWQWLDKINHHKVHSNNWRFFRILVNLCFRIVGRPWSKECCEDDWNLIESCSTEHGWYFDGNPGQIDYYIAFAIGFYGLVYSKLGEKWDPGRARILRERGAAFSRDFVYWFGADGNEIPFGRSLTYRFAHSSFFSAMAFAGEEGVGYGVMKHLVLGNLRTWLKRPIFDNGGVLTIGYGYPTIIMSERYNAPGSPYWGLKTFLMLALEKDHPFWTAEEEPYPYEEKKLLPQPHMLITHDSHNHVLAYVAGQHYRKDMSISAKYEKFVYSNRFGFSIPRGVMLEEGAFDSVLAVSPAGEECYRVGTKAEWFQVTEDAACRTYAIGSLAKVTSVIIPAGPWHVRVHKIKAYAPIDIADGGFAIKAEPCFEAVSGRESGKYTEDMVKRSEGKLFADFPWGVSGVAAVTGGEAVLVNAFPNTNVFYNLTVIPTVTRQLEAGDHTVITCVLGDLSDRGHEFIEQCPTVEIQDGSIVVDGGKIKVPFSL